MAIVSEAAKARKRERTRQWQQAHPEEMQAKAKERWATMTAAERAARNVDKRRAVANETAEQKAKKCAQFKQWRKENDEYLFEQRLWKSYKLTRTQYDEFIVKQEDRCKICGKQFTGRASRHVDHNHKTGAVRGLLCNRCNLGIGNFDDDPATLLKAAAYLNEDT
jgi:restriction endonuclease Mrr